MKSYGASASDRSLQPLGDPLVFHTTHVYDLSIKIRENLKAKVFAVRCGYTCHQIFSEERRVSLIIGGDLKGSIGFREEKSHFGSHSAFVALRNGDDSKYRGFVDLRGYPELNPRTPMGDYKVYVL